MKFNTKKIVLMGLFVSLLVIANILTIQIIPPYFVLSFVLTISFFVGYYLGSIEGTIVCFLGDFIGCIIHPLGPFNILVSLSCCMMGLIFGFNKNKTNILKIILTFLIVTIICTCGLSTLGLWLIYGFGKKTFFAYLWVRLPWQLINSVINCIITIIIYKILKRSKYDNNLYA